MTKVYESHGQDSRYREMEGVCETLSAKYGTGGGNVPMVVSFGLHPFIANANTEKPHHGPDGDGFKKEQAFTLASMGVGKVCIAMSENGNDRAIEEGMTPPLKTATQTVVSQINTVRRLTPVECERLQGMPDDWTRIPYRGKPAEECPDSPRYKAIGNSWAVPVVRWIGKRIDEALKEQKQ